MSDLTSRQRAVLRSLAQTIKPILQVGKDGVSDTVAASVEAALHNRELLKVRVLETAPAPVQDIGGELVARVADAQLVQVIGRTVVIFRRHPEKPEITLPDV